MASLIELLDVPPVVRVLLADAEQVLGALLRQVHHHGLPLQVLVPVLESLLVLPEVH